MKNKTIFIFISLVTISLLFLYFYQQYNKGNDKKEAELYAQWLGEEILIPMSDVIIEADEIFYQYEANNDIELVVESEKYAAEFFDDLTNKAKDKKIRDKELISIHKHLIDYLKNRQDNYNSSFHFYQDNNPSEFSSALESWRKSEKDYNKYINSLYDYLDELEIEYEIPEHYY